MSEVDPAGLPKSEFAFPGPLRDELVASILAGTKTATAGLLVEYEQEQEPLPEVGDRSAVVDSEERPVAVIEVTEIRDIRVADVDLQFGSGTGGPGRKSGSWRPCDSSVP